MCRRRNVYTMAELNLAFMKAFNEFNKELYNNELPKVVITFEAGFKKGAFGWITTAKNWKQGNAERYHINISSDYLDRPVLDLLETLLHEMCHLYALTNDIKDTSRSGIYHNKRFKQIAEAHGLNVKEADQIGWSVTSVRPELAERFLYLASIASIRIGQKRPTVCGGSSTKTKQSSRKYICPCCGLIVRATKDCRIKCIDCNCEMERGE